VPHLLRALPRVQLVELPLALVALFPLLLLVERLREVVLGQGRAR
jgi:hypothetical protein